MYLQDSSKYIKQNVVSLLLFKYRIIIITITLKDTITNLSLDSVEHTTI